MLKLYLGGCMSPPQIWIADSGRRKGVQNLGLGVQNCTKWVRNYDPVFYVKTAFVGGRCMSPTPQIWIADSGRRKGVQNLVLGVQNCTKWVQNYIPVIYVETAFRVAVCLQPSKFELRMSKFYPIIRLFFNFLES